MVQGTCAWKTVLFPNQDMAKSLLKLRQQLHAELMLNPFSGDIHYSFNIDQLVLVTRFPVLLLLLVKVCHTSLKVMTWS